MIIAYAGRPNSARRTRKGVNILDSRTVVVGASTPLSFCLFTRGPSRPLATTVEGISISICRMQKSKGKESWLSLSFCRTSKFLYSITGFAFSRRAQLFSDAARQRFNPCQMSLVGAGRNKQVVEGSTSFFCTYIHRYLHTFCLSISHRMRPC
jgi:hypothetical protein